MLEFFDPSNLLTDTPCIGPALQDNASSCVQISDLLYWQEVIWPEPIVIK
jgi:hypothetical protein